MVEIASGLIGLIAGPSNIPKFANDAIDKASVLLFGKTGKKILEEVQLSLREYSGAVPQVPLNHDLEHAITTSALTAALVLIGHYKKTEWDDRIDRRGYPIFLDRAWALLIREIRICQTSESKSNKVIIDEISGLLDRALSEADSIALEKELAKARDRIWGILITGAGEAPEDLAARFHGQHEGEPGWSILFVAFIREALKSNPRAETAFVTTRLAAIIDTLRGSEQRIRADIKELRTDRSELLLIIKQNEERMAAVERGEHLSQPRSSRFIDANAREIILSKLSIYRHQHQINLKELSDRIAECVHLPSAMLVKELKRFMQNKGVRIDDSIVALISRFTDKLPNPSLPYTASHSVDPHTRIELAVNDRAEAILFHNRRFKYPVAWLELNSNTSTLNIVVAGGLFKDFQVPIQPELLGYMKRAHRALLVLMDEETGEPIEGDYVSLIVVSRTLGS